MNATTSQSLFYLYGLIPADEVKAKPLEAAMGIDEIHEMFPLQIGNVMAVICELDEKDFSESIIEDKVNHDMEWLQAKAFHHHEALQKLHNQYTLIPLKFCTIYKSQENVKRTIEGQAAKFELLFSKIAHKEEWNLKIFCDDDKIKQEVALHSPDIQSRQLELEKLSPGRQFFEKKKLKQMIDETVTLEKSKHCDAIHEQLGRSCSNSDVKKNWTQEMSGRKQDMNWNGVYLVDKESRESFIEQIEQMQGEYKELGFTMEYTGPWPCYHFANL